MKEKEFIIIEGANEHNLKNINLKIPRNQLVVITGLSGSGKSSLAFDTIYAEGQRRYIETFSSYARRFLGKLERPNVDKIDGLPPVIAIEQKTTTRSPRSTVGTITEIYDFLRLLFARIAEAYSSDTGKKMIGYTNDQIQELITKHYLSQKISLLSPVVKSRKGHYRELLEQIAKKGFIKARIDGDIVDLKKGMKLDRYKTHDIEIVIDRIKIEVTEAGQKRLQNSIKEALHHSDGAIIVVEEGASNVRYFSRNLMCPNTGISYPVPEPNTFSFNSPKGMCSACSGLGFLNDVTLKKIIPDDSISIANGGIAPIGNKKQAWVYKQIELISRCYKFSLKTPIKEIPEKAINIILHGGKESFSLFSKEAGISQKYKINFEGITSFIKTQLQDTQQESIRRWAMGYTEPIACLRCHGSRLEPHILNFKIAKKNIAELSQMNLSSLSSFFENLNSTLSKKQLQIAKEILKEIKTRINFLEQVGLGYLSLNRPSRTLSGGESQRIRLATQIGSQLVGVLYILDEPSIGLHQRDNDNLINSLKMLRDIGNSVIVVEHDKDMMLNADYIIDIGPKAGKHGGEIVFQGTANEIKKACTETAKYINGHKTITPSNKGRKGNGHYLELIGCRGNNLKNVTLTIPLGQMICVTGVSGSGKSTLVNETLYPILNAHFFNGVKRPLLYKEINGLDHLDKVIGINQSPIGRTPRSNPATYTGVLSHIRQLFAKTPESLIRGYQPGQFSFNVKGGRCEACKGAGLKTIEMGFLPSVYVNCEICNGKRFNRETLEIRYKGKAISDILDMTINESVNFFEPIPKIYRPLKMMQDVGLGYITLGQQSTSLSGGEAQRIKLSAELSKRDTGNTLYILDEPTTGLHFDDIQVLMNTLGKLVDRGNTIIVIEHNIDVIRCADYIIDIGPEASDKGGTIVVEGTPDEIIKSKRSHTAKFLQLELK